MNFEEDPMRDPQEAAGWAVWAVGTTVSWVASNSPAAVAALGGLLWAGLRWWVAMRETRRKQTMADAEAARLIADAEAEARRNRIQADDKALAGSLTVKLQDAMAAVVEAQSERDEARKERDAARQELAQIQAIVDKLLGQLPGLAPAVPGPKTEPAPGA